ncbi:MAG: hypothetical protein J6Q17_04215 [Clostridia bacterium]|nr:hypothetical protein [Clostridia bacterium]
MKKNIAILAVLWVAIAAVWIAGFRWESWIAAPQTTDRTLDTPDDEPILYIIPETTGEPEENPAQTTEPVERSSIAEIPDEEPAEIAAGPEEGSVYVVNTKTKKIHLPACSSVGDIKPENRGETDDPDVLLAEGYAWCKRCHG